MSGAVIMRELAKPFDPKRIHWRVGSRTKDKSKGMALAYIDARDVMKRLDEIQGAHGVVWQNEFLPVHTGTVICRIGLLFDAAGWVWRSSGAGETQVEGEKGATSDAFKRAAVMWGIGRYLYQLDSPWVELDNGFLPRNFQAPALPKWATPEGYDEIMKARQQ